MMTLAHAYALIQPRVPAARLVGNANAECLRVHSDTRTLAPGDLFVALRGERFDAHQFLPQARAAGAAAAMVHAGLQSAGLSGIEVPDTLAALGALATAWRAQWHRPLIAVTGSNGKTTVTQMIAAVLHVFKAQASLATRGNLNNAIGLPLTLLRLAAHHEVAVVELGMNHPGEIAYLADMAQPTVALVNNAQREHLEFMHTVDAVARENGSVLAALPADGVAVFPAVDPFTSLWRTLADTRRCLCFGTTRSGSTDVWCESAQWSKADSEWHLHIGTKQGIFSTRLAVAGFHNVLNALAATACALAVGVSLDAVAQGLARFTPLKGRSRMVMLHRTGRALTLVDDSYNANPDSVRAAIDLLAGLPGPRLLVLGDMGEVGVQGTQLHVEAGMHARASGIEKVFTLGTLTSCISPIWMR